MYNEDSDIFFNPALEVSILRNYKIQKIVKYSVSEFVRDSDIFQVSWEKSGGHRFSDIDNWVSSEPIVEGYKIVTEAAPQKVDLRKIHEILPEH
jgi:hypothetical protein